MKFNHEYDVVSTNDDIRSTSLDLTNHVSKHANKIVACSRSCNINYRCEWYIVVVKEI